MGAPFISGRSKLGNFLLGTAAGAIALCPIILVFTLDGGFDARLLLILLASPLIGVGVLASGTTPEVKEALDIYEAERAAEADAERERRQDALAPYQDHSN